MTHRQNPADPAIRRARMASLLLDSRPVGGHTGRSVVSWFGAMQGQDLASVQWSLGLRAGLTRAQVRAEFESGAIVRTWPMRGTLHAVAGEDAHWMVAHFAGRDVQRSAGRRGSLGIADSQAQQACSVLSEALSDGQLLTRAQCFTALADAGIAVDGQRGYHLLRYACQRGVTCVGPNRGSEQTFASLVGFAPAGPDLDRPAALAQLAMRFVRSHGPVTVHDLARWGDLTIADARSGLRAAPEVSPLDHDGRELFVTEHQKAALGAPLDHGQEVPAAALPGFDEFVIGYRDRSDQVAPEYESAIVPGGNGVFTNTLALHAQVVGTWRRTELSTRVKLAATALRPLHQHDVSSLESALAGYADFLEKEPAVTWADPLD